MDDYLSMSQLESVWQYQDAFTGAIETPLATKDYTFQEIPEAPTIVKHKHSHLALDDDFIRDRLGSNSPRPDEAMVVDGIIHPALRPAPYLQGPHESRSLPLLPKLKIPGAG